MLSSLSNHSPDPSSSESHPFPSSDSSSVAESSEDSWVEGDPERVVGDNDDHTPSSPAMPSLDASLERMPIQHAEERRAFNAVRKLVNKENILCAVAVEPKR